MAWKAVLDGELRVEALRTVREVAELIATGGGPASEIHVSAADRTLFWAYTCGTFDEPFANAAYEAAVDDLIRELRTAQRFGLFGGGLAGSAWVVAHVLGDELGDALTGIDAAIARNLAQGWTGPFDLTHGLAGIAVYLLERVAAGAALARHALELVVAHFADHALYADAGACWYSTSETAPAAKGRPDWPDPHVDVGLAHGVAGVVGVLARASAVSPQAARLCRYATRWLSAQYRPSDDAVFPAMVAPDGGTAGARTGWCYGDPGVASALWLSAVNLGEPPDIAERSEEWMSLAHATALAAARRDAARTGVDDPMLCHGASGLAHMFNRFYQASGDEVLGEAARRWFARTLDMRRPDSAGHFGAERGCAYPTGDIPHGWMGASLALLAAATDSEPRWDRMFLCDLPVV